MTVNRAKIVSFGRFVMKVIGVLSIAVVFLVGSHSEQNKERVITRIEDRLKVSFDSVYYREQKPERLDLLCEVHVLKPDLVLGTAHGCIMTQLETDKGGVVDVVDNALFRPSSVHYNYGPLSYQKQIVLPKKPARWKTALRSVLRLPPLKREVLPQRVYKPKPNRVRVPCDLRLLGPDCERINRVQGYFHVLMAESHEYIDVPFEPNEEYVRLTPDLEIKVLEAQTTDFTYNYLIETRRREDGSSVRFHVGSDLPNRLPAGRQFLDRDGNPINPHSERPRLPAFVGGRGRESCVKAGRVKKIRFVIAVNPRHHKIPFELKDIPLPKR